MRPRPASLFTQEDGLPWAGVDEAGRGCIAGPVVAAAVILPAGYELPGLGDSKKLSAKKRTELACAIKAQAISWNIGIVWQRKIEEINILEASLYAMAKAAAGLAPLPKKLLIDGPIPVRPKMLAELLPGKLPAQDAVIHGDALIPAISAASIVAKTTRDALMVKMAAKWPQYGFGQHKGYGTASHYQAILKYGPCPLHRRTFRGVLVGV